MLQPNFKSTDFYMHVLES